MAHRCWPRKSVCYLSCLCTNSLVHLQPLWVFTRPSFKRMIDIASCANHGVKLPSLRQTCGRIIRSFKQQMIILKDRLNVSLFSDLFHANYNSNYNFLEPCRAWWSKPHMWRMAGRQHGWILCSHWALDRGRCCWGVDWRTRTARFHAAQHCS